MLPPTPNSPRSCWRGPRSARVRSPNSSVSKHRVRAPSCNCSTLPWRSAATESRFLWLVSGRGPLQFIMKLASRRQGRDGALLVVSRDGSRCVAAHDIAPNLQAALDDWSDAEPPLRQRYQDLQSDTKYGQPLSEVELSAPL